MTIPMCWKCSNQITEMDASESFSILVGCTESDKVVDYPTAMMYCPICKVTEKDRKQMNTPV
jgi:hypothetical protein